METEVAIGLHHGGRLLSGRVEGEQHVRLAVLDALHVRHEVGICKRDAHGIDDLPAAVCETLGEGFLGFMTRSEVADRNIGALESFRRPLAEGVDRLP